MVRRAIKHMEEAFKYLNSITVSGANVDILALARQELRKAYQEVKDCEEPEEGTDGRQTD